MAHQKRQTKKDAGGDPETGSLNLKCCPVTGERAKMLTEVYVVVPNGPAIWWHCSICQGWHVYLKYQPD